MSIQKALMWPGLVILLVPLAMAQDSAPAPAHDLVRDTTEQVMVVVNEAQGYVDDDPERYYQGVQEILEPLIDFRGFARNVMGPYASSSRYRSLGEEDRAKLRAQLDAFTEVMRTSLVRTYSKGLLAFGSARIEVLEPDDWDPQTARTSVRQHIFTDRSEPYVVLYQMGKNKENDWKLRNVIIESVNLGEIYRDQFQSSARELDGDLDKVIAEWTVVEVDVED
ncbi:MAG: ABC transporter substrate-binding protein [Pseudomonadota bacterium]